MSFINQQTVSPALCPALDPGTHAGTQQTRPACIHCLPAHGSPFKNPREIINTITRVQKWGWEMRRSPRGFSSSLPNIYVFYSEHILFLSYKKFSKNQPTNILQTSYLKPTACNSDCIWPFSSSQQDFAFGSGHSPLLALVSWLRGEGSWYPANLLLAGGGENEAKPRMSSARCKLQGTLQTREPTLLLAPRTEAQKAKWRAQSITAP